jgi:hypothetical protein
VLHPVLRLNLLSGLVCLCLIMIPILPSNARQSEKTQIIIARTDHSVELFVALPALQALELFNAPQGMFLNEDGLVDFDAFRAGTADTAEALWQGVEARIGQAKVSFEPMSLMLHPQEDQLPFTSPWDGLTAVSVCSSEGGTATLEETVLYLAMIAYTDQAQGDLTLKFPARPEQFTQFYFRNFEGDAHKTSGVAMLGGAQILELPAHKDALLSKIFLGALLALAALAFMRRNPAHDSGGG